MVIPHAGGGAGRSARDITLNIFLQEILQIAALLGVSPEQVLRNSTALPEASSFGLRDFRSRGPSERA